MRPVITSAIEKLPLRQFLYAAIMVLPVLLLVISLLRGAYPLTVSDVMRTLLSPLDAGLAGDIPEIAQRLILNVRLPRVLAALLIGGGLAVSGVAFQGIFKNPLVDSNLLGVTAGAGFGASLVLLLQGSQLMVQIAAFGFGLLAVSMAFFGSKLYRTAPMVVLTLMGILIGSLFGSLTSLLKYLADPLDTLPSITFWLLGGLTGVTWADIPLLALFTGIGSLLFVLIRWQMNVLSLGDAEAATLGLNPDRIKLLIIISATLMTAIAVSVGGVIGWVGLVIPHAGRILVGPDHSRLIPVSLALGASFLLLIDTVSRTMLPTEVPLGVLTGMIGVPLLIVLLRRNRTGW